LPPNDYIVPAIAVAGTLLGGWVQHHWDERRERREAEREERMEIVRAKREDLARWATERREIYARYLSSVSEVQTSVRGYLRPPPDHEFLPSPDHPLQLGIGLLDRMEESKADLELVASASSQKRIEELHDNTVRLVVLAIVYGEALSDGEEPMERWLPEMTEREAAYRDLRRALLESAKQDLGTA
jgi:hypothetical protein